MTAEYWSESLLRIAEPEPMTAGPLAQPVARTKPMTAEEGVKQVV